jgi:serine/threonine protein kinase/Leucine-rich repeat (LRR) protein
MAVDLATVVKQLTDSGIIAPGKLENFVPPKADPKTVEELVQALVKSENLTAFQGQQVKGGKAKSLILGEYTILDKIGAGGMGQVFKAQHRRLKRVVAVKMLPPAVTKDAAAVARFQREVEAAAKLRHPNVVATDDAGYANGVHFLVMEYVDGKDLSALVKKNGPFPVNKAVNYILQAARGLEFAHKKGVIHRDVKPANLLLDDEGVVKILDMGLARIESGGDVPAQAELTGTGTVMGTVDYMAPEQALNTKNADARADIYSLGISLYYLIAGRAAYSGDSLMEKLVAHREQPIPSLQEAQTTVPKQLETVFKKMVAKKIENRYQTMTEVVAALERLGYGGSGASNLGDLASTIDLSSADKKKLASKATKKPLDSLTEVVASEKTKHLVLKIVGGTFATIIAPILVTYLIKHLEKKDEPHNPPAAPVVVATPVDPDRRAAEWVLSKGGYVRLASQEDANAEIRKLPDGNIQVRTVVLERGQQGKSADLVTNADLENLTSLRSLQVVGLSGQTSITDEAIITLSTIPSLHSLYLGGTKISDSGLVHVKPGLYLLELFHTEISDDGLLHLYGQKKLNLLIVAGTSVTASGVAALQKALPNCKIEWPRVGQFYGQPATATQPVATFTTPVFQAWMKQVQAMPAEKQVEAVSKKLMELNPGFDGNVTDFGGTGMPTIENGVVTEFGFSADNVTDISPVRALMGLKRLGCNGNVGFRGKFSDLSPLRGRPLVYLSFSGTQVSDLSPLEGMRLTGLYCHNTKISDLSPLNEMPLRILRCYGTPVSDLSPLQGMNLTDVYVTPENITKGMDVIRQMNSLKTIAIGGGDKDRFPPDEFWKKYDAGEFGKSAAPAKLAYLDPAFQAWMKTVAAIPAEKQVDAVAKKLMELNPGFDGKVVGADGKGTPKIENAVVTELSFLTDNVTDISPVRVLIGLKRLYCHGTKEAKSKLSDLTPLHGMQLTSLGCGNTNVSDLSPLQGMPLTRLSCYSTQISDLLPLTALPTLGYLAVQNTKVSPDGVAALQKAVPNCKIEWPTVGQYYGQPAKLAYLDPAFQAWMKTVAAMPAAKQVEAVTRKLQELNPGFDGKVTGADGKGTPKIENGVVTWFRFRSDSVTDISPVRALAGLKILICPGSSRDTCRLSDLSPLQGMSLMNLDCANTQVSDLSPLRGMRLTSLYCYNTQALDLSPLTSMSTLAYLKTTTTKVTPASVAALQKALPNCKIEWDGSPKPITNINDPAFQAWMKTVASMPANKQVDAVLMKLVELNPGFDGKATIRKVENGVVTELEFLSDNVTDISPVRALTGLKALNCGGNPGTGKLCDLSPLEGMPLTSLHCRYTLVSDLSPMHGMPLTLLNCGYTNVSDLTPLQGMPLATLYCGITQVSDLSPLKGMTLTVLDCYGTQVSDLSPVLGMRLARLHCESTRVSDLSPIEGMDLTEIYITPGSVTKGMDLIRRMKTIKTIGIGYNERFTPDVFWKKYDAGEFGKAITNINDPAFQAWMKTVAALPAEKQVDAVAKKLMELNPGFDGKVTGGYIVKGVVVEVGMKGPVRDISPVRALAGLKVLGCTDLVELFDLSPLEGMKLERLYCSNTQILDLSPLRGMPLSFLHFYGTRVSDLSPLQGMPLTNLNCGNTRVSDLSPLTTVPTLDLFSVYATNVTAASVAALQKALPNCKIEWPTTGTFYGQPTAKPITNINDPAFRAWMKSVAAMPAEKQVEAVAKKLMELNPGFDGKVTGLDGMAPPKIENGVVTQFGLFTDNVADISPVRAFVGLKSLTCHASDEGKGKLVDLSPLRGIPLTYLNCSATKVSDVSPLQGMPLTNLLCSGTQVADLSPLRGMSLTRLFCRGTSIFDLSPLQDCKSLKTLDVRNSKVTPASVASLQKALPNCKIEWDGGAKLAYLDPAFQQWMKTVAALPAEKQVEAVSKKLMELNPGFDGVVKPGIHNGAVYDIKFLPDNMTDISPVRALAKLNSLNCVGTVGAKTSIFSDLSPLQGMKLTVLNCGGTQVSDLSPLREMPLTKLYCLYTPLSDLLPLTDIPTLTEVKVQGTKVTAASVAALQKALPNCKIEWDDPAKAKTPGPAASGTK